MALCNAYQFFLLVGLLGSFRSDVVNGQGGTANVGDTSPPGPRDTTALVLSHVKKSGGGLTNQTTNGDTLTASPNQTVTSIQNSTDANTDGRSRNTTTVLTTPEIIDTLTDLTTLSDTHTLKSESSAFTDLTTSETSEEGRELVTGFGATTIFKPVTQMWNNEGTGWSTESDDTAIPRETYTEEMMTTLPLEFTTVGDNLQVSTPDDDNDDLTTNAMEHEYNRDWSTESDDTTALPEDNTTVMLTTLPTEVVTDIDSEMQLSTLNGEYNGMDTTSLDEGYATDWSTQSDKTTVLMETYTAKSIGTSHTEYVSDVDSTVSTLNDEYDDLTTKELADEYETAFTTEADSFRTTEIWTELFGDLITTDQSTSIAGENEINTDVTLHEYATTLSLDATTFNEGMSTDGSTELVWSTVMDDTQTTIVTQEDQLTSEITDEDVATNFMAKISTEMNRNRDNKNLSEMVTIFEDLTTVFDIEGTGDVTTSWPSQDVELTEMVTILNELHTGMDSTDSTKSDYTNIFVTENSQDRSDVESTTLMMENTRTEKASGDDDKEEDSVTEIIFTEEYVTETSSSDDKTSNESLFTEDVTTYETGYDNNTKTTDKSTFTTNSALSVTTKFPFTTEEVVMLDNTISFLMKVDMSINITEQTFIDELEQELSEVIQTSASTGPSNTSRRKRSVTFLRRTIRRMFRRHRRALNDAVTVTVTNVTRQNDDPEIVKTTFTVDVNGTTLSATNAASLFDDVSESKLSAALGYEVLSKPVPENLPGTTVVSLGPLDVPSGDLRDFLMITLLVPLSIDISGAVFQTDVANGLESLYLAGMELSSVNNRKRRRVKVLLDGRIITVKETERLRRRRQDIEDPSEEYVVKGIREHFFVILPYVQERNNLLGNFSEILVVGTNPSECTLFTMDVSSLYTSIPHHAALAAIRHYLDQRQDPNIPTTTFLRLTELVLTQNCFQFNGRFFRQIKGVAMGTKLGPSVACLTMGHFEEQMFSRYTGIKPILYKSVVYDLVCKRCNILYVGETKRRLADRVTEHLRSIKQNLPGFPVATHFNPPSTCSIRDLMISAAISCRGSDHDRLAAENRLIMKLGTLSPHDLKLKSVNRPISTKMEVDIVFCVVFHDQVIRAESAIERLEMLPLSFMTTVLGYQVKEPGVTVFKNHGNRIVWLIIIADIAVIVILLIILAIYCCCVKVKRAEFHKQALLSKVDRSTSIEMGFVRIGVQSSDQMATTQKTKKHKSGAHVMHGTARDKVHRKRHRKQGAFISEYRLGGDSSSDEDSKKSPHLVKPSQIVSHNRIHPDVSALVPFSGTDDEYDKQEYIRRFKKRDDDEDMRRQQHLQEQLNKEMTARLGAASGEGSSLRSQIGEMFEGAANLNITDRKSANNRKKKKTKKLRKEEAEIVVEDSGNRKRKLKKKTVVHTPEVATKVTPQKKTIQRGNSFTKSAFDELTNNRDSEVDREIVYQELCRKWRKERKRLNKFLDEAFTITASLLDTSKRTPSPVRPLQRSPVGEEMSPLYEIHANPKLPTNRDSPTNGELSTNRELPPIRQTPLTVAPLQPNPYLYHHSVGVPYYFPADSSQIDKSDPYLDQMYEKQLKKEVKVPLNQQRKSKENKTQNKVDWLQTLTKYDEKLRHVPTLKEDSIKKRKSRKNKYS
ncbi:hypothetical protein HOLleu_36299 [Holothuria leucospilota]|uniref:Reverse transcriptase domain-containing protein n=1 Tax=Holothuria leucospilota TaxID=206669 RepID=A0A9Q1BEK5_HOLLE|nr:hypothetical protein HOLleu_36299 [Holothuria leucospilota]